MLQHVAAFAKENHHRAVRLRVRDPEGEWVLGVNPDGTGFALDDDPETDGAAAGDTAAALGAEQRRPSDRTSRPAAHAGGFRVIMGHERGSRRLACHRPPDRRRGRSRSSRSIRCLATWIEKRCTQDRRGRLARLINSVNERLKDPAEREEEELDRHFARRYLVTDTNLPVVVSPKGGPGKTTVALIVGDALASRMANQRVAAIDFNPGGGALEAVATEDRVGAVLDAATASRSRTGALSRAAAAVCGLVALRASICWRSSPTRAWPCRSSLVTTRSCSTRF